MATNQEAAKWLKCVFGIRKILAWSVCLGTETHTMALSYLKNELRIQMFTKLIKRSAYP